MKIALAIDDLKPSQAVQAVINQARPQDTEVLVLHVVERPSLMIGREMRSHSPALKALWQETEQQAEAMVKKVAQELSSKGFTVRPAVEKGDPKSRIIDFAVKRKADLIVLGSHGRKGLERFLTGSVSEAVTRYAPCSVEIAEFGLQRDSVKEHTPNAMDGIFRNKMQTEVRTFSARMHSVSLLSGGLQT